MSQPAEHSPSDPVTVALRLLQTTDLHGNLRGYDYFADHSTATIGLTRTAAFIRRARSTAQNCLLFDTGDFLQGTPLSDLAAERCDPAFSPHPVIAAMNALNYDALTPGNHDFNYGLDVLLHCTASAQFPIVSSNILYHPTAPDAEPTPLFAPFHVLHRSVVDTAGASHDLRIGVIGCLPPQTVEWDHALSDTLITLDMAAAVSAHMPTLREQADIIVLLAHTGICSHTGDVTSENDGLTLASIDGIDAMFAGHIHAVFPGPMPIVPSGVDPVTGHVNNIPTVMAGFWGNHLGQIDLCLERAPSGAWSVTNSTTQMHPLTRRDTTGRVHSLVGEDPEICALTAPAHAATLRQIRRNVGQCTGPLHSFFSLVCDDASVQLVARAQAEYVRARLADTPHAALPLLSAAAPFKCGQMSGPEHYTNIAPGPLTQRSIADLYFYPNTICALKINGLELRNWLEHSASLFNQLTETDGAQPLLDTAFPGYNFDVITGVTYEFDLSQPPRCDGNSFVINPDARRVKNLMWQNAPVRDDMQFLLATNSYRAHGIGASLADGTTNPDLNFVLEVPVANRDILLQYVKAASPIAPDITPTWSFSPLGGCPALFETAPDARAYLSTAPLPRLDDLGDLPNGFAQLRLWL